MTLDFLKYVNFALSVPMYFIRRKNKYIDCSGGSFLDFINGKLPKLEGIKPLIQDWEDHFRQYLLKLDFY